MLLCFLCFPYVIFFQFVCFFKNCLFVFQRERKMECSWVSEEVMRIWEELGEYNTSFCFPGFSTASDFSIASCTVYYSCSHSETQACVQHRLSLSHDSPLSWGRRCDSWSDSFLHTSLHICCLWMSQYTYTEGDTWKVTYTVLYYYHWPKYYQRIQNCTYAHFLWLQHVSLHIFGQILPSLSCTLTIHWLILWKLLIWT